MKIKTKLLGTVFLSVTLLVISTLGATLYLNRLNHKSVDDVLKYGNELEMVFQLELAFVRVLMPANDYLIHGDEEERYTFEYIDAEANEIFDRLEGKYFPTRIMVEEKEFLNRLKGQYALIKTLCEKILNLPDPIGNAEGARLMEEMNLLVDNLSEDMRTFRTNSRLAMLREVEVITSHFYRYLIIVVSALATIVISSLFYGRFLAKSIIVPIRRLVECMGNLAKGDLTQRLDIKTKDEMGTLAERFNYMTEKLKTSDGIIKGYTVKLESMVKERTYELTNTLKELRTTNVKIEIAKKEWEDTFDAISDSICIIDRDCRILRANMITSKFIEIEMKNILGNHCYKVFHGTDKPLEKCPLHKCFESGEAESLEVKSKKLNKTLLVSVFPRFDEDGKILNFIHVTRDITKRKQIEEALLESEERFRTISTTANDAIIMVDNESIISYWNKAAERIFDFSKEEAVGRPVHSLIIPERLREDTLAGFKRFQYTEQGPLLGKTIEVTALKKDGTEFPTEISLSAVKIKGKWHAIGMVRDITERKSMEEQVRMSYKMASLGQLTAGVFHEILNPVNIISSHVQLLLMEAVKGSKTEEDLNSIQEEIKRIVKITDGLLRFSRKGEPRTEEVETNSLLEKIISIVEPEMKLENVRFIRRFEEGLPKVMANIDELRQVFLNLIHNAGYAMPDGGKLTISTQSIKKQGKFFVRISFTDTGCGIPKEYFDKVFEPFFSTKGEGEGTGLGLSISYGIIDNHGGKLSVESEKGKGATFTVDLPAKD